MVTNLELVELFKIAYDGKIGKCVISLLYKYLVNTTSSILYVKALMEKEGGFHLSEVEWTLIWKAQWKCTILFQGEKFAWKMLIKFFITYQKSHYDWAFLPAGETVETNMQVTFTICGTAHFKNIIGQQLMLL